MKKTLTSIAEVNSFAWLNAKRERSTEGLKIELKELIKRYKSNVSKLTTLRTHKDSGAEMRTRNLEKLLLTKQREQEDLKASLIDLKQTQDILEKKCKDLKRDLSQEEKSLTLLEQEYKSLGGYIPEETDETSATGFKPMSDSDWADVPLDDEFTAWYNRMQEHLKD